MHSLAMALGQKALVLKEFNINPDGEEYVHIVARKAGLISWIMTHIGIDSTIKFNVYANHIEFQEGSLSGQLTTVLPLSSVSISQCGYMKPFILLVLTVIFLLLAIPTLGIGLILAIITWIFYYLNKNMVISVVSNSGWPIQICFKRSVIEGVKVEFEQAQQVVSVINQLIMAQSGK